MKIDLQRLAQAPSNTLTYEINERIADFESLTPVAAEVTLFHGGNFLQVEAEFETIVTLPCDRCLQHFNYRLEEEVKEIIWLAEPIAAEGEVEIPWEDLYETLPTNGVFDLQDWLYQQLNLALPSRYLCQESCQGLAPELTSTPADWRWQGLAQIKESLGEQP